MRESETQLRDRHQHTRDRSPQTNQQKHCGDSRHQLRDSQSGPRDHVLNGWNRCYRSQEHESGSRPTFRKSRE